MNYRTAYGDAARAVFILDTPGPTPATVRHVQYRHMQRPHFPLDKDIAGLQPSIFTHEFKEGAVKQAELMLSSVHEYLLSPRHIL